MVSLIAGNVGVANKCLRDRHFWRVAAHVHICVLPFKVSGMCLAEGPKALSTQ